MQWFLFERNTGYKQVGYKLVGHFNTHIMSFSSTSCLRNVPLETKIDWWIYHVEHGKLCWCLSYFGWRTVRITIQFTNHFRIAWCWFHRCILYYYSMHWKTVQGIKLLTEGLELLCGSWSYIDSLKAFDTWLFYAVVEPEVSYALLIFTLLLVF